MPGIGGRSQDLCRGRREEKRERKATGEGWKVDDVKLKTEVALKGPSSLGPAWEALLLPSPWMKAMPAEPEDQAHRGGGTQLPLGQSQSPPHRCVFILKEGLSSGFSKQLPREVQLVLRHKLK